MAVRIRDRGINMNANNNVQANVVYYFANEMSYLENVSTQRYCIHFTVLSSNSLRLIHVSETTSQNFISLVMQVFRRKIIRRQR